MMKLMGRDGIEMDYEPAGEAEALERFFSGALNQEFVNRHVHDGLLHLRVMTQGERLTVVCLKCNKTPLQGMRNHD